jgi:hypothetical protein
LRRKLASLGGVKRKRLLRVIGYLEHNRAHMRYDEYLAAGYPILHFRRSRALMD